MVETANVEHPEGGVFTICNFLRPYIRGRARTKTVVPGTYATRSNPCTANSRTRIHRSRVFQPILLVPRSDITGNTEEGVHPCSFAHEDSQPGRFPKGRNVP